jgi:hypothetical protein
MSETTDNTVREQEARIHQLQMDATLKILNSLKREQDIRFAPWALLATGLTAGAALFGAAIAFLKWIGP